jgi:collagenase-like PrtC family protease
MHLSVPSNFQKDFIDSIRKYKSVKEVYSKLTSDFTGGGRASVMVPKISKSGLKYFINNLHSQQIEFNYLLNFTCLNNQEITKAGYNKLRKTLDWLSSIEVDSLTVATPYLCEIIKRHYPHFKIKVSAFAGVNNLHQVKYWENLGAHTITLEPQTLNREFGAIETITNSTDLDIQLIVNQSCLYSCPNVRAHANLMSHASQSSHYLKGFFLDYYSMKCKYLKLKDPVNFIRNTWIRPEDISEYEKIGVKNFKIIQRNWPTDKLERITKAYSEKHYDGNLADLGEFLLGKNQFLSNLRKLQYFFRPAKINLLRLLKMNQSLQNIASKIEIDNNALDGFINIFTQESCQNKDCDKCKHCHNFAEKAVTIKSPNDLKELQKNIDWLITRK